MADQQTRALRSFYRDLSLSWHRLFVRHDNKLVILSVIELLETGRPILNVTESIKGSFSTIFLPFHDGSLFPHNFKALSDQFPLHPKLVKFCRLAGEIERLTGKHAIYPCEPKNSEREKLLEVLKEFAAIFPSYDEFCSWLR